MMSRDRALRLSKFVEYLYFSGMSYREAFQNVTQKEAIL